MMARLLLIAGSAIFLLLGSMHLYYTFFSDKFLPRKQTVKTAMEEVAPILTRGTTMWKAWIGFNASHSSGAMFIGAVNILIGVQYFEIYAGSLGLQTLNILTAFFYLFLARRYWFSIPFYGMVAASAAFLLSAVLTL